jgi:hypothetical protein
MGLYCFDNHRIVRQAIDQYLSLGELKRSNFYIQPAADLIDHTIDTPPEKPSDTRDTDSIQQSPPGYHQQQDKNPGWYGNLTNHLSKLLTMETPGSRHFSVTA